MKGHPFNNLDPRGKPPPTVRAIESWIQQAEHKVGIGSGRLGWMVASGVVIAALQRSLFTDGQPRFLIKGGAYLELRLGLRARTTKDIDTLFRGSFEDFVATLDTALAQPFDGITFRRTELTQINAPGKVIKPRRFDVLLQIRGRTWRRISVEVSSDEGRAGSHIDRIPAPPLKHFGLAAPSTTAGIVLDYQVAQKLHACTDPHTSDHPNDRVRDVIDLHLLKSAFYSQKHLTPLSDACRDVFAAREAEAKQTEEVPPRSWPPTVIAHPHWHTDFTAYAKDVGLEMTLREGVDDLNTWIKEIDQH
ncbi:MAG: nucleotidyl transferase AbiEii/AbiGii toxin family protein [Deltaproteobacteria bacterium]|nr:nucleotidyl transferase AbiEii/AbiGii toxin family protein [Deltaproteobacteria bacterium]